MAFIRVKNEQGNFVEIPTQGSSAYEIAKDNGFEGTEAEWLESLKASVQINQSSDGTVTTFTTVTTEGTQETAINTNPLLYGGEVGYLSAGSFIIDTYTATQAWHGKYIMCTSGSVYIRVITEKNFPRGTILRIVNTVSSVQTICTDYQVFSESGGFYPDENEEVRITVAPGAICTLLFYSDNNVLVTGAYSITKVSGS